MHFVTDPSQHYAATRKGAVPIHVLSRDAFKKSVKGLGKEAANWAKANGFEAAEGDHCLIPAKDGSIEAVLFGTGNGRDPRLVGKLARVLPKGVYRFEGDLVDPQLSALSWGLGGYNFSAFKSKAKTGKKQAVPKLVLSGKAPVFPSVEAAFLVRDLINTPADTMGPDGLEQAVRKLAKHHAARVSVTKGDALLTKNFPMVHAVGRASTSAPRVIDLKWGNAKHPKVTLVGKGVTFDTGGLNIKPGSSMALMKKDMGGAANVLGLAHMIMAAKLPVRLRVIIGAVENAIAGNAFRPGDVLSSRKGITVEIGNTDAEGRLVLGDCLALGDEEKPQVMIDMATLTGAARVALGPDLPPFYTDDDAFASELADEAEAVFDPVWRMPLWRPYNRLMTSRVADVNHINTSGTGFAGSVTAALFLDRFVENAGVWAHFDIFGWMPADQPWARTGGEAQAIRALYSVLAKRFSAQ